VCRIYTMQIDSKQWLLQREGEPSAQRFVGTIGGDTRTISGRWERPRTVRSSTAARATRSGIRSAGMIRRAVALPFRLRPRASRDWLAAAAQETDRNSRSARGRPVPARRWLNLAPCLPPSPGRLWRRDWPG